MSNNLLPLLKEATAEMSMLVQAVEAQTEEEIAQFSNPQVGPAPEGVAEQLRRRYNQKVTNIVCRLKDVALESNLELNLIVALVDVMRQHNLPIGRDVEGEIEEMLETLHRVDTGSEHDRSSFNANEYHQSYGSEDDEEVALYADDGMDGYNDAEEDAGAADDEDEDDDGDDDDRTESTALATLDNGYGDWSSGSGSQRRQQPRRLSITDDGSASEHHRLGEDPDIEDGQRSEQEEEPDEELRAAAEAVRDVEPEDDTWTGDEDTGWLVYEVSLEEFQQQETEAIERLALTEEQQNRIREWQDRLEEHERRLQLMQARRMMGQNVDLQLEQVDEQENEENGEDANEGDEAYDGMADDLEAAEAQLGQLPGVERDRSSIVRPPLNETQSVASQMSEDRSQDMFDQRAVWPDRRPARDSIHPADIQGQMRLRGVQGEQLGVIKLRVIFEPHKTGFEETKDFSPPRGAIIAGRYKVLGELGQAAFSTALQCVDMKNGEEVCLKMIKNNKDYFDQSIDEIKLLQYINTRGDPDEHHVLRLYDFFYHKEHLFLVSELLRENLYEFQRFLLESGQPSYFTIPRLKKIMKQVLEALHFIHGLNLIHCDVKPENIVIKSYSRCEVKLIDFGSSCYTHDHATSYIQSRSYRAPEVILGLAYNQKIDIWSLGAVLSELFTGYVLFQNESIQTMLARIGGIVGPFPEHMLHAGTESHRYFTTSGVVYEALEDGSGAKLIYPKPTTLRHRLHTNDEQFLDFNRRMLSIDPQERPTAWEALQHPFLADINEDEVVYRP